MSESHRNLWTTVSQLLLLLLLPLRLELLPLLLELLPLLLLALTPPLLLLRFSSYLPPPAVRERNSWSHAVKSNPSPGCWDSAASSHQSCSSPSPCPRPSSRTWTSGSAVAARKLFSFPRSQSYQLSFVSAGLNTPGRRGFFV